MDIYSEIKQILINILDREPQDITPDSLILRDLGAESVDLMELAVSLRTRFNIEVNEAELFLAGIRGGQLPALPFLPPERLQEISADCSGISLLNVRDLASYVEWKLKGK